jgi:hypothetical protein
MPAPQVHAPDRSLVVEFDRQLVTLLDKDYPALSGLSEEKFLAHLAPLRAQLDGVEIGSSDGVPFLIVVTPALTPLDAAVARLALKDKAGFTDMAAEDLARFGPIDEVAVPDAPAYLVTDVETGTDLLGVTPQDALPKIVAAGRSPLTISEGVALVTHRPDLLRKNACFSLLGSRCGDRRVTALWISKGRPRLGWCYAGAPHSWLGSASCATRLA